MRRRGADSGFPGKSGGSGDGAGGASRRAQSQYGNGAAAVPAGAHGGAVREIARRASARETGAGGGKAGDADEIRADARAGRDGGGSAAGDARLTGAPGRYPDDGAISAAFT